MEYWELIEALEYISEEHRTELIVLVCLLIFSIGIYLGHKITAQNPSKPIVLRTSTRRHKPSATQPSLPKQPLPYTLDTLTSASKMPATSAATTKLKSTLRLLIPRLRNAQKKDTSLSIAARREMAELLSQSREQSARIRVENIIHTDITVELMEILELYAELLLARAGLLDVRDKNVKDGIGGVTDDTGLEEAAASIIFAAPRLPRDVRELAHVRNMLVERFGKDFAAKAQENVDGIVPARVADKLKVEPPGERLVTLYLTEIAKTYGVDWPPGRIREELEAAQREVDGDGDGDGDDGEGDDGGQKEPPILADGSGGATPAKQKLNLGPLPPSGQPNFEGSKSPVSVAPPGARTDNVSPRVKPPGGGLGLVRPQTKVVPKTGIASGVPTVDDLAARFSALKKS